MASTIQIETYADMTAEQKLETIQYPLENLESFLMMLSKLRVDDKLSNEDFCSVVNIIHQQIAEVNKVIKL